MTAAIAMADYTGPEADNLCYAIRKKKEDVLRQHEAKFKAGAKKKGIPPHIVDQVFADFEPFARYGFNKAHATCYGLIAYQTAYLKANYPIEFMTAVLNGFSGRAEKVAAVIAECRHLGHRGAHAGRPEVVRELRRRDRCGRRARGDPLRHGRDQERRRGRGRRHRRRSAMRGAEPGPFVSLDDFCRRVDLHTINRRVIESLIKSSAMASLGTAGALLEALDAALENGARHQRDVAAGQSTLFDLFALPAEASGSAFLDGGEEIPRRERLRWEKELIGLYLSEHPLGDIAERAARVRHRLHGRPGRGGGPGQGHARRDHPLLAPRDHPRGLDDARRHPRGPHRARSRSSSSRESSRRPGRRGSMTRSCSSPGGSTVATRRRSSCARRSISGTTRCGWGRWRSASSAIGCWRRSRWTTMDRATAGTADGDGDERSRASGTPPSVSPSQSSHRRRSPLPWRMAGGRRRSARVGAPEPAEEPPAPTDAVPLQSAPVASVATVAVLHRRRCPDRVAARCDRVGEGRARGRPGPLPVVLSISVAGATRQVRLPDRVAWDERLGEAVGRAAGVPVNVELRAGVDERLA